MVRSLAAPSAAESAARAAAERGGRIALLALLAGAVGIAFAPIFVRLSELGPTATALWRPILALPLVWLIAGIETRHGAPRPATWRDRGQLVLAGLFFAGDLGAWHWSIHYTTVANATFLANCAPVFVTLGGWLLFRERTTLRFIGGMLTALAGAMILMGESLQLSAENLRGDLLGLFTALWYAAYILAIGRARARFRTYTVMTWSTLGTAVGLVPLALLAGEALSQDIRAEMALMRAELDLLKQAFRRHCRETSDPGAASQID